MEHMEHPAVQVAYDGVTAVVEYDYKAKEIDELDLAKGDILHNIVQQPGGWWEGTLSSSGKTGMFPDNFVRVLEKNENNTVILRDKSATIQRRCKAIFSYTQVNEDELTLAVGDVIEFLGEVEEGWWRGKLSNKIGVFPSNFVTVMQTSPIFASKRPIVDVNKSTLANKPIGSVQKSAANSQIKSQNHSKEVSNSNKSVDISNLTHNPPVLPPRPVREYCRVEFPYSPQNDDELELVVGEIITILNKELPDKGWWKGEVDGKSGVFPDNFVKLIPLEESPLKENTILPTDTISRPSIKKNANSENRLENFGSRESLDDILNETGIQSGNVAAQRKSLENKKFEHPAPSVSVDRTSKHLDLKTSESRKSIENLDEKKLPPPLLTKKPTVPGKKSVGVTNVAGNILSGLRQKVKSVEQKLSVSQDCNDGGTSSKYNMESIDTSEKINSLDKLPDDDNDFDKVERASILTDMRAGRVKAPKRRPPSVATSLSVDNTSRNSLYLNGIDNTAGEDSKISLLQSSSIDEQVKPKNREWEKKKVPWMDELKASQVKKKTSPFIEPRTTLADTPAKLSVEEKQISSSVLANSKSCKSFDSNITISSQVLVTKSSTALHQSVTKETDVLKSISDVAINKVSGKDNSTLTEDGEVKTLPPVQNISSVSTKIIAKKNQQSHEIKSSSNASVIINNDEYSSDEIIVDGSKINEIEKRVQSLEKIVQAQQKTIDDLQKMLRDESMRIEMLKNQLEKYAQCVTQV